MLHHFDTMKYCTYFSADASKLFLEVRKQTDKRDLQLAPSKEVLSLRAYTAQRHMNNLRRAACMLFQSEQVIKVIQKLEIEIETGRLRIREDRALHADLGI